MIRKSKRTKVNFPGLDPLADDMPEELRRAIDITERVTEAVARRVAAEVDAEITKAIQMRIGTDWKPRDLIGRLQRTIYADGSEVMVLDDIAFMHIGPWKFPVYDPFKVGVTR